MVNALNVINRVRRQQRMSKLERDASEDNARKFLSVHGVSLDELNINNDGERDKSYTERRFKNLRIGLGVGYNNKPALEISGEVYYAKYKSGGLAVDENSRVPFRVVRPFNYDAS